jgi:hypothetical protein
MPWITSARSPVPGIHPFWERIFLSRSIIFGRRPPLSKYNVVITFAPNPATSYMKNADIPFIGLLIVSIALLYSLIAFLS